MRSWLAGTILTLVMLAAVQASTPSSAAQAQILPIETATAVVTATNSPTPSATSTSMAGVTTSPTLTATITSTATPAPTALQSPTVTPTAPPSPSADAYEPNDTPEQAAAIDVGQRIEKLSFWPLGDIDYFAVEVKAGQVGVTLTVDTYQMFGLDTKIRSLRPDGRLIAENDDVGSTETRSHIAATLPEPGRYVIEVSNQSETRPDFKTYSLETAWQPPARTPTSGTTTMPAGPTQTPTPIPTPPPGDALENNYDFDHARQIAVGERVKGLNFVCPEGECADNDFFSIVLKGGQCYRFETTDLTSGIDTNLIVYGADRDRAAPLGGNDDVAPGEFRSQLHICLPENHGASSGYILIGNVGNRKPPEPIARRTYTLAVTLITPATPTAQPQPSATRSPTATPEPTETTRATTTREPTATVRPTATSAVQPAKPTRVSLPGDGPLPPPPAPAATPVPVDPAPPSQAPPNSGVNTQSNEVPSINDAPKGLAIVVVEQTDLHVAPGARTEVVQSLWNQEQVKLFGQARGAWVRVQPFTSVVPGWVYAADLRPLPGTISGGSAMTGTLPLSSTTILTPTVTLTPRTTVSETATSSPTVARSAATAIVEVLPDPVVAETAVPELPRVPVEITVEVVEAAAAPARRGGPTSTPVTLGGVAGMRVQIVTVFGELLVEAATPSDGRVTFTRDVPPDTALFVQIPALGLRIQLPADEVETGKTSLTIAVPRATRAQPQDR